jgi:DNA topoisomerase I
MKTLVIVESPKKVEALSTYLGDGYRVAASAGHVRDLPSKPKEGIGFAMPGYRPMYEILDKSTKTVAWLKKLAAQCDRVILATDPDREGEAIAWHLAQVLRLKSPLRMTFNSITKSAVLSALENLRPIDMALVAAQEARRAVDRLVGYQVSRPLSDAIGRRGMSAGRVQSPAVALVVERERSITSFVSQTHFDAVLHFLGPDGMWRAAWQFADQLQGEDKLWTDLATADSASKVRRVTVLKCEESTADEGPPSAFTTSLMQQASSVALGFNPETTMRLAQSLKDKGHITYHRTDNPNLSDEGIEMVRNFAQTKGWEVPTDFRRWKSKKGAQEAHEAIRPTDFGVDVAGENQDEQALYQLIRLRAIACQLADARYAVRQVTVESLDHPADALPSVYQATGRLLIDKGWRTVLSGLTEADEDAEAVPSNPVPTLGKGVVIDVSHGECRTHQTQPPKRFSEASLVKALDNAGVGRPATYVAIMNGITAHAYVEVRAKRLYPTDLGFTIYDTLKPRFSFMDIGYTRKLEERLDDLSEGRGTYLSAVETIDKDLQNELQGMVGLELIPPKTKSADVAPGSDVVCPCCGKPMFRRIRKSDKSHFWGCSGFPDCKKTFSDKAGKPVFTALGK